MRFHIAVANVELYDQFLPWCLSSDVLSRDGPTSTPPITIDTEISVGWQMMRAKFRSKVLVEEKRIHAVSEPNEHLEALQFTWDFSSLGPKSCRLDLHLDFCLRSAEHVLLWDFAQDQVISEYLNCFTRRCAELDKRTGAS